MKPISYARQQERYGGKFIARVNKKALASGKTMKKLFQELSRKKIEYEKNIIIEHIHPKGAICIYANRVLH